MLEDRPVIFIGVGILNSDRCSMEKYSNLALCGNFVVVKQ